ncbi:hypothetical protein LOAG_05749, partial [Loa loa]
PTRCKWNNFVKYQADIIKKISAPYKTINVTIKFRCPNYCAQRSPNAKVDALLRLSASIEKTGLLLVAISAPTNAGVENIVHKLLQLSDISPNCLLIRDKSVIHGIH